MKYGKFEFYRSLPVNNRFYTKTYWILQHLHAFYWLSYFGTSKIKCLHETFQSSKLWMSTPYISHKIKQVRQTIITMYRLQTLNIVITPFLQRHNPIFDPIITFKSELVKLRNSNSLVLVFSQVCIMKKWQRLQIEINNHKS